MRQGKGGLGGVAAAASTRTRTKVQFSAQQTAEGRKAAGRMLRRVRSGKRGKLSALKGKGSPRAGGGVSPRPGVAPPQRPAGAPKTPAAPASAQSISADEWSKKTPEEQAAARKAYVCCPCCVGVVGAAWATGAGLTRKPVCVAAICSRARYEDWMAKYGGQAQQ